MATYINPSALDAALAWIRDNTTRINLNSAQPTTYTEANTTYALGTLAFGTANWTIADGDGGGRKITANAATVPLTASGTMTHISFSNEGTLGFVGTCIPAAVSTGGTMIVSDWDIEEFA